MNRPPDLRFAALRGDEHTDLGDVTVETVGANSAVALSRGKYPKGYPYVDPNEDAILAGTDGSRTLLAVADGHRGFEAAKAATGAIVSRLPDLLQRKEADQSVLDALAAAQHAVTIEIAKIETERAASRTALAIAITDGPKVFVGGLGDCRIAVVRGGRSKAYWPPLRFSAQHFDRRCVAV